MPLRLDGFAEFERALAEAPERAMAAMERAMHTSVNLLEGRAKVYPPATSANRPGRVRGDGRPMGYYERHRGWWYPLTTARTLGGSRYGKSRGPSALQEGGLVRAPKALRGQVLAYRLAKKRGKPGSSEFLGQRWASEVRRDGTSILGVVGNTASYAGPVKGFREGDLRQSRRMQAIGWPSIEDDFEAVTPDIQAAFDAAVDGLLKELAGK